MLVHPLLLALLALHGPDVYASVYYGPDARSRVRVDSVVLGEPVDLVVDRVARKLLVQSKFSDGFRCLQFSLDGTKETEWRYPDGRRPLCRLHRAQGVLRTVLWTPRGGFHNDPTYVTTLSEQVLGSADLREANDLLAYDVALAPERVAPLQKLLLLLQFIPPRRESSGLPPKSLDWVMVNACQLGTHLAVADDRSIVSYSWDMVIKTEMAARQPNGNYHLADMAEPVKRALGLAKRDYTTVDVLTVTASRRLAAYGVSIRAPSGPRPFVLSYDVAVWPPALISKKPGYLARELDRFP